MMSQPAMSAIWDGEWEELLPGFKLDELLFKNEVTNKEVHDSSSNASKYKIAEQTLHDIEDLGRNSNEYWLDELPLFDEIQTPKPSVDSETKCQEEIENFDFIFDQEHQLSPKNGSVVPDAHIQPSEKQDLFSVSHENTATFILSNANVLYINDEPFVSLTPAQNEWENHCQGDIVCKSWGGEERATPGSVSPSGGNDDAGTEGKEMTLLDEILQSTVAESDLWETDTSRSEVSSDGTPSAGSSPKGGGDETDDPDWKPDSPRFDGAKKHTRRAKPYWRGGSPEEKKLRKKEQNKNAATRYRQKKKAEVCEILKEEESLKERKAVLQEKMFDIQSEIKYVKALMRDLFKAKGIL